MLFVGRRDIRFYERLCHVTSPPGGTFRVPAELEANCREQPPRELILATRYEALVERGSEPGCRSGFFNGRCNGPPALARIGDTAREAGERGVLKQRQGRQVEQPGYNDAPATPHLGDIRQL